MIRYALALLLAAAVTASCGSNDTPASPPAPAGSAEAASPIPSPSLSPSGPVGHKLGEPVHDVTAGWDMTITVHAYRQPSAPKAPPPDGGGEWGSAEVQWCLNSQPAGMKTAVSWRPWALVFADGGIVKAASVEYSAFPQPMLPNDDRIVPTGRCVRGWVTFAARTDARPALVEYQPEGVLLDWTVN